jgi:hypothetical protein
MAATRRCAEPSCPNGRPDLDQLELKATAKFCSSTCKTRNWRRKNGVRLGYIDTNGKPRKRKPRKPSKRTNWKAALYALAETSDVGEDELAAVVEQHTKVAA